MDNSKGCIDCKFHCTHNFGAKYNEHMCTHPKVLSILSNYKDNERVLCTAARSAFFSSACGPHAAHFETKPNEFDLVTSMNSFDFIEWLERQSADKIEEYYEYANKSSKRVKVKKNIFWLIGLVLRDFLNHGGYNHENFNKPTGPPPLKLKMTQKPNIIPKGQKSK